MDRKTIGAGAFKQGCLALIDDVAETHTEIVITKRGRPVAKLVPFEEASVREAGVLAGLRGRAQLLVSEESFLEPTDAEAGWNLE